MAAADPFRLDGKVALVTGAGRGIGRAVALALAAAGAEIVANSRTPAELETLAGEIAGAGGRARILPVDVTDTAGARAAISGLPRLDIIRTHAGTTRPPPFDAVGDATLARIVALHIKAALVVA